MINILVATDFSKNSREALQSVLNLVKKTQDPCRITLLNTYLVRQTDPREVISLNDQLKNRSRVGLEIERLEAERLTMNPKISFETMSRLGSLPNVIQLYLLEKKVDLVVMGRDKGKTVDAVSTVLKEQCPLLTYQV